MSGKAIVIGAGLAGTEAAYQLSRRGIEVDLYEMRPAQMTEAHQTEYAGELVCSNSLGSMEITSAAGLLKKELEMLDSFYLRMAHQSKVPAGSSLSVDRLHLAEAIDRELAAMPGVNVLRQEIKEIPRTDDPVLIASGPLTSPDFATAITTVTMRKNLFFYDATSPIIRADTIDMSRAYRASRYDKGEADFLNLPLTQQQYESFVEELVKAETVELKEFEKRLFFDACLPIEEIARRGFQSLAFGPLKPVGLTDPATGRMPHAVVQLRQDDLQNQFFQMVGFQTRLKWDEQKRIFRMLPGLEEAQFERFGRMHRNTYIVAPLILNKFYQTRFKENLFFCGQISGVEGYVEAISSGLAAGIFAAKRILGEPLYNFPEETANGALIHYITQANWKDFRPTKFTFGLLPELPERYKSRKIRGKKIKKEIKAKIALDALHKWLEKAGI